VPPAPNPGDATATDDCRIWKKYKNDVLMLFVFLDDLCCML